MSRWCRRRPTKLLRPARRSSQAGLARPDQQSPPCLFLLSTISTTTTTTTTTITASLPSFHHPCFSSASSSLGRSSLDSDGLSFAASSIYRSFSRLLKSPTVVSLPHPPQQRHSKTPTSLFILFPFAGCVLVIFVALCRIASGGW